MTVQQETFLCRYHYDPLDRVASCIPLSEQGIPRYYRKDRFATEVQGKVAHSLFEHEAQVLAQQRYQAGRVDSALLATDLQRSVLHSVAVDQHQQFVYSPYGHRSPGISLNSLLAFNGEHQDRVTGHYLLGNGYRAFNPVLMRFNSPDNLSPFGKGGVNAYAYCLGDPVNLVDSLGQSAILSRFAHRVVSVVAAAGQRGREGIAAVRRRVAGKSGKTFAAATQQATELLDEARLRDIGAEFRVAEANVVELPPIARFANSKGYSQEELFAQDGYRNFPEVKKQYQQSLASQERLRQADVAFLKATGDHKKRYPHSILETEQLVELIRS